MAVLPVVKSIYVCDEVRRNPLGGKVDMVGACNSATVPWSMPFPYQLPRMSILVQMSGGHGDVACRLEIVQAKTLTPIYVSAPLHIFFQTRHTTIHASVKLDGILIPDVGEYWIEWYCDGTILDDKLFYVNR